MVKIQQYCDFYVESFASTGIIVSGFRHRLLNFNLSKVGI